MNEDKRLDPMPGQGALILQQSSDMQKLDLKPFSKSSAHPSSDMLNRLRHHWPEYMMEAAGLGIFMVSASLFTIILEHPDSPVRHAIADPFLRRMLIGIAMGLTAIGIIYSPWGKQSGAHINPRLSPGTHSSMSSRNSLADWSGF